MCCRYQIPEMHANTIYVTVSGGFRGAEPAPSPPLWATDRGRQGIPDK